MSSGQATQRARRWRHGWVSFFSKPRRATPIRSARPWSRLQATFDREADEFLERAGPMRRQGNYQLVAALATVMMQRHVELFEKEWRKLNGIPELASRAPGKVEESVSYMY